MPVQRCVNTLRVLRVILFSVVRCIDDLLGADITDGDVDVSEGELTANLSTVERELVDIIFEDVEREDIADPDLADSDANHPSEGSL